jgi:hypothetical protein
MRIRSNVLLSAAGILLLSNTYASCGSSACIVNTNWDEHSAGQPGLSLDLRQSFTRSDQLRSGSNKIAADTTFAGEVENLRTITKITTLSADYTVNEHYGITGNLPYVSRDHIHNLGPYTGADSAGQESFNAKSLGDIKIVGRYRATLNESEHSSEGLKVGLKLPTGRKDFTLNTGAVPNEATLQPGNGSTDLILGAFWNKATPGEAVSWFAQGTLQHSLKHDSTFRPGNQFNLDGGLRYNVGSGLNGLLQINAQWSEIDTGSNAALTAAGTASSGGKTLSITPGLSYALMSRTNVYALLQLPIIQSVNAEQLTASKSFTVGINHRY